FALGGLFILVTVALPKGVVGLLRNVLGSGGQTFSEFVGGRTVPEALIQWAKTRPGNKET
ncbi:MAG TPA: hypothetical protein DIT73_02845, partial [Gammaproteobacteria bacterium]|nr:hypothetical protein [Gammaproteobacteria bacterium]